MNCQSECVYRSRNDRFELVSTSTRTFINQSIRDAQICLTENREEYSPLTSKIRDFLRHRSKNKSRIAVKMVINQHILELSSRNKEVTNKPLYLFCL